MNALIIFSAIKRFFVKISKCLKAFANGCRAVKLSIKNFIELLKNNSQARKRYAFLSLSFLFFVDYIMICYHMDKNVLDFFPVIPIQESYQKINIFIPTQDGTILEESRDAAQYSSKERLALFIFNEIVKGSHFENTSAMVPAKLTVRKVWIDDSNNICAFDIDTVVLSDDVNVISGSEKIFLDALTRSIKANISEIKDVKLLERGVQSRIWEI